MEELVIVNDIAKDTNINDSMDDDNGVAINDISIQVFDINDNSVDINDVNSVDMNDANDNMDDANANIHANDSLVDVGDESRINYN